MTIPSLGGSPPPALVVAFKLNCPPPTEQMRILGDSTRRITLMHGTPTVEVSRLAPTYIDGVVAGELVTERIQALEATYLIIEVPLVMPFGTMPYDARSVASEHASAMASAIESSHPHLIAEKSLDEVVYPAGQYGTGNEGPMTFTGVPPAKPEALAPLIVKSVAALDALDDEARRKFSLSSRWFWQGFETLNQVDRFLSWYIALEVFPADGTGDVPGRVRDFIQHNFYPEILSSHVKERLDLGRLTGLRADIVHNGIRTLGSGAVRDTTGLMLKLQAVVRAMLRFQTGQPYDRSLDKWVLGTK